MNGFEVLVDFIVASLGASNWFVVSCDSPVISGFFQLFDKMIVSLQTKALRRARVLNKTPFAGASPCTFGGVVSEPGRRIRLTDTKRNENCLSAGNATFFHIIKVLLVRGGCRVLGAVLNEKHRQQI